MIRDNKEDIINKKVILLKIDLTVLELVLPLVAVYIH